MLFNSEANLVHLQGKRKYFFNSFFILLSHRIYIEFIPNVISFRKKFEIILSRKKINVLLAFYIFSLKFSPILIINRHT